MRLKALKAHVRRAKGKRRTESFNFRTIDPLSPSSSTTPPTRALVYVFVGDGRGDGSCGDRRRRRHWKDTFGPLFRHIASLPRRYPYYFTILPIFSYIRTRKGVVASRNFPFLLILSFCLLAPSPRPIDADFIRSHVLNVYLM